MTETLAEGLEVRELALFHESDDNPRTISDERFEALKYAIAKDPDMLQARPVIAGTDGEIVAGNMRHRAMVALEWTEGPIFVKELTQKQRREWMLRDNQEYGDWVPEELAALVKLHADEEGDLRLLGLTEEKTDNLLKLADDEDENNGSAPADGAEAEVWGVIVECESEEQQAALLEELSDRGLEVRSILS